jgi:hypothetical protein
MTVLSRGYFLFCLLISAVLAGCSGSSQPVTSDMQSTDIENAYSATGLLGAYELVINPDDMTADLHYKRTSSIGESYIVNGRAFFETAPCTTCLRIKSLIWHLDSISIIFELEHPIPAGNSGLPASAMNRFDLDVFDVAALVRPGQFSFTVFSYLDKRTFLHLIKNPDGYTAELEALTFEKELDPYVLVVDDSETGTSTWNKFEQGTTHDFEIEFLKQYDGPIAFNIFITMAYGVSARFANRLTPKYYNPEFNRKAAWKVEVEPRGMWTSTDSTSPVDVEVRVWDWQQGATVSSDPDYADADPGTVYAASNVNSVSVELDAMINELATSTTPINGTGMPNDPLIYRIPVKNEKLTIAGQRQGLVRVMDSRSVLTTNDPRDILIDTVNGVDMEKYTMPEYATYQLFTAAVIEPCTGYCWTRTFGGIGYDQSYSTTVDRQGYVYITGSFGDAVVFDPSGYKKINAQSTDTFLCKYDPSGNFLWFRTWGGLNEDEGKGVAVDSEGNVYVVGQFCSHVEFNPAGGERHMSEGSSDVFVSKFTPDGYWIWTKTFGGADIELANCLDVNSDDSVYVGGAFKGTTNLKPQSIDPQTSNGGYDSFIVCLDSSGDWLGDAVWGGTSDDIVYSLAVDESDSVIATGCFETDVDFNPTGEYIRSSNGLADCFITKFNNLGQWQWARTWGGPNTDNGISLDCDSSNNIYVTGYFSETVAFNPFGGPYYTTHGGIDCYLSKFDQSGTWQRAKTWGGISNDICTSVHIDTTGNLYVAGSYTGSVDFNPDGGGNMPGFGFADAFLSLFNLDGDWQWTKTWGGTDDDTPRSVATDLNGNIFTAGYYRGTADFNPTGGGSHTSEGNTDMFLSKFNY